ncbi:response regulator [Trinickia sp.]|uniref:response regulator n=1 Tax=Trinickia sp. TaxID=2571163 RepID=UPI003F7D5D64
MLDIEDSTETDASPEGRILIVDDDALARFILADQLDALGCRCVDTAADGIEALRQALVRPYELVITDLCMPNMGGQRLLAALRTHGLHMPVVAGTAWREPAAAGTNGAPPDAASLAGFAAVLRKPISIAQLQQLLRAHLGETRFGRDRTAPAAGARRALQAAFCAAWPEDEKALRAALAALDTRAMRERLHRLHGALAVLGEARARRACTQLQQRIAREGLEPHVARIERFMHLCARIGRDSPHG